MKKIVLIALALAVPAIEAKGVVVVARPIVVSRPAVVSTTASKPVIVAKSSSSKTSKTGKSPSTVRPIVPPVILPSDDCEKKTLRCE